MKMSNRIAELRTKQNKTQSDLAAYLDTSRQAVSLYEKGEREPKLAVWEKIAKYFGVSISYVQGITDSNFTGDELKRKTAKRAATTELIQKIYKKFYAGKDVNKEISLDERPELLEKIRVFLRNNIDLIRHDEKLYRAYRQQLGAIYSDKKWQLDTQNIDFEALAEAIDTDIRYIAHEKSSDVPLPPLPPFHYWHTPEIGTVEGETDFYIDGGNLPDVHNIYGQHALGSLRRLVIAAENEKDTDVLKQVDYLISALRDAYLSALTATDEKTMQDGKELVAKELKLAVSTLTRPFDK